MKKTVSFLFALAFSISVVSSATNDGTLTTNVTQTSSTIIYDSISIVYEDTDNAINFIVLEGSKPYFFEFITEPTRGEVIHETNRQSVTYTPEQDYFQYAEPGPIDSFFYSVEHIKFEAGAYITVGRDSIWVIIDHIHGSNDKPVANKDSLFLKQDAVNTPCKILANDFDPDKSGIEVKFIVDPKNGNVKCDPTAVSELDSDKFLFFPKDGDNLNSNLKKPYNDRDISYMESEAITYNPNAGFYGYDSIQYVMKEYRPDIFPPFTVFPVEYEFVWFTDADTATVIFYVEPYDLSPEAYDDILVFTENDLVADAMEKVDITKNDKDNELFRTTKHLSIDFIIANAADSATATPENDTVYFEHTLLSYNYEKKRVEERVDSNMAVLVNNKIIYYHCTDFSGIDSLSYRVFEAPDTENSINKYPDKFRKDTSNLAKVYFVIKPTNDLPFAMPDTLAFDPRQLSGDDNKNQLFDLVANDIDIDKYDLHTLNTYKRLLGNQYDPTWESFSSLFVKGRSNGELYTKKAPRIGKVLLTNDSIFYRYQPYYSNDFIIDSFKYFIFDEITQKTHAIEGWAFITNEHIIANDINLNISQPFIIDEEKQTIANQISIANACVDPDGDTIKVMCTGNYIDCPTKSSYARIKDAGNGNINYYFRRGFTTNDSFQYIVNDVLTKDTAWVHINNTPCQAFNDTAITSLNAFQDQLLTDSVTPLFYDNIYILDNDVDDEGIKQVILPSAINDTLNRKNGTITMHTDGDDISFRYHYKKEFFYKDSFMYTTTDIPIAFADENLFTRDNAWAFIEDKDFLMDSDGDNIVNTLENRIEGYQQGEEKLDFDNDGTPNYLDLDADGDGFKDSGDSDGDGILNFLDDTPGYESLALSTAFTPNGDGINDLFEIPELVAENGSIRTSTIKIYNRLGKMVYQNNSYGNDGDWWDGTVGDVQGVKKGESLPDGVYFYYLTYANNKYQREGFIHITR